MTVIDLFIRRKVSLQRKLAQLGFLKRCRDFGVIPKFLWLNSPCPNDSKTNKICKNAEFKLLNLYIRKQRSDIFKLECELYYKHLEISKLYNSFVIDHVFCIIDDKINKEINESAQRHNNKLNLLLSLHSKGSQGKQNNPRIIEPNYLNLTQYKPTPTEEYILNQGPKFAPLSKMDVEQVIADTEACIEKLPPAEKPSLRSFCAFAIDRARKKELSNNIKCKLKSICLKQLKKNTNFKVICADKTSKFVLIDNKDFIEKAYNTINSLNVKQIKTDPTEKIKRNIRALKKKYPEHAKSFDGYPIYTRTPPIFFKAKIHKPHIPFRPIVNRQISPALNLEKYVNNLLKPLITDNSYSIKSSQDFLDKLKLIKLTNTSKFYSLDVVSLYPSIPIQEIKKIITDQCKEIEDLAQNCSFIEEALDVIFDSNCFSFDEKFYTQLNGVGMGSVIAPTLGEITMKYIENKVINNSILKPLFYVRYVDDIFIIWDYTEEKFLKFQEDMNGVFMSINLTIEKERNNSLPFLDVMVHRNQNNNSIWTDVYYKPSAPLDIVSYYSYTSKQNLNNAITPLLKRAITHTSFQHSENKEMQTIKRKALEKGYPINTINKLILKVKNNFSNEGQSKSNRRRNEIKFIGAIQFNKFLFNIINIFKNKGYGVAFKSTKLSNLIVSDRVYNIEKGGIYEIPIITEDNQIVKYIGKTRRNLKSRISDHKNSLRTEEASTALKEYLFNNPSATPQWHKAKIITSPQTDKLLEIMEKIKIWRSTAKTININKDTDLEALWWPTLQKP